MSSARSQKLAARLSINPDEPAPAPTRVSVRPEPTPTPSTMPASAPAPLAVVEPTQKPAERTESASRPKRARTAPKAPAATEDPIEGRMDYRSFYVNDEAFLAFRSAIYWTSRNPAAVGKVPDNMSAAAETWMRELASDLERRFNNGEPFPEAPVARRRRKTS